MIKAVLFDIDGVLVTSWMPIEGAASTLRTLAEHQIARSYLTNTTTRTRVQIAELLTDAGMVVRPDEVITAAVLTADFVRDRYPGARCFLVNSGDIAADMPGLDIVSSVDTRGGPTPDVPDVIELVETVVSRATWAARALPGIGTAPASSSRSSRPANSRARSRTIAVVAASPSGQSGHGDPSDC